MKSLYTLITLFFFATLFSCDEETTPVGLDFVAAFEKKSIDFSSIVDREKIQIEFSRTAESDGSVWVRTQEDAATYALDYETLPHAANHLIELPFKKGDTKISFEFINLIYPFDRSDKKIQFFIHKIDYSGSTAIQGYTDLMVGFGQSVGGTMLPEIGGPTQPYQVFIDLSKNKQTGVKRDTWDIGFYNGTAYRVILNNTIYMATKALDETDITKVTRNSVKHLFNEVAMGTFDAANEAYVDSPTGDILKTAIAEIQDEDAQNKVYLINLGFEVGTGPVQNGSVGVAGDSRGWKKARFLKRNGNYVVQYADLNDPSFTEIEIPKNPEHTITAFNFKNKSTVNVEPPKNQWDISFTVFTNIIEGSGSYGYSDFVTNNMRAGVKAYMLVGDAQLNYKNFTAEHIDDSLFQNDQRVIGSAWRDVFTGTAYPNNFYIVKDLDDNYYAIKMLEFLNPSGERGHPKFEYRLIQSKSN